MRLRPTHPVSLAAAGFIATAGLPAAMRAEAQVIQIADDGAIETRRGTGAVEWDRDDAAIGRVADLAVTDPALADPAMSGIPSAYAGTVARASTAQGISPALLAALIWQESRWRATAVSPVGARGLTQLMPGTARALGVDPRDPVAAIEGGARYLRQQLDRFDGNVEHALAAYNAGPGRVLRAGGIPAITETRRYVAAILTRLSSTTEK